MTPGERRRRDRKYAREEGYKRLSREYPGIRATLEALPHPKRSIGTAYDYVDWCIYEGYTRAAFTYIESL